LSRLQKVISLIGMPGGGKSSIGKLLARRLAADFADVDSAIERSAGYTIAKLFEREGEAAFRRREADALRDLVSGGAAVVSTGGGVVLSAVNRELLRSQTIPVYLFASPAELWRRVRKNSRRPLLQVDDPYARLCELFEQRHRLYSEVATIVVETGRPPMREVVDEIVAKLERANIVSLDAASDVDRSRAAP
jgi:shikimate kinase